MNFVTNQIIQADVFLSQSFLKAINENECFEKGEDDISKDGKDKATLTINESTSFTDVEISATENVHKLTSSPSKQFSGKKTIYMQMTLSFTLP